MGIKTIISLFLLIAVVFSNKAYVPYDQFIKLVFVQVSDGFCSDVNYPQICVRPLNTSIVYPGIPVPKVYAYNQPVVQSKQRLQFDNQLQGVPMHQSPGTVSSTFWKNCNPFGCKNVNTVYYINEGGLLKPKGDKRPLPNTYSYQYSLPDAAGTMYAQFMDFNPVTLQYDSVFTGYTKFIPSQ